MEQLQTWLNAECDKQNLSWRQASIRAGINPGAIGAVMNGIQPGLEVCKALAHYFRVRPEYVLQLAGHLPERPEPDIPRLQYLVDRLNALPRDQQERFMEMALMLLEFTDAQTPITAEVLSGAPTSDGGAD